MNRRCALEVVHKRHLTEQNRTTKRKRGNCPKYLEAIYYLKKMNKYTYCEWCLWPGLVFLHHGISWRHNLPEHVIVLCTSCHLRAHDGCFRNPPNQQLFHEVLRPAPSKHVKTLMRDMVYNWDQHFCNRRNDEEYTRIKENRWERITRYVENKKISL